VKIFTNLSTGAFFKILIVSLLLMSCFIQNLRAQVESDERALIDVQDGISIKKNDKFLLNLRFRMQNRLGFTTVSGEPLKVETFEARVRRMRLRFDGFVLNKKLQYYFQLSFSRADQDLESGTIAQIIRDAILYYHFSDKFYIGFGQSKLPGNRQRVNSSGNLQFTDRSIVNASFNIDRDFGLFSYYSFKTGGAEWRTKLAITSGDGRNASPINNGLAYTGRIEFLPLGPFKDNGDFSEGDLEREETPKISIAAAISFNNKASRISGQLGSNLLENRDITTYFSELLVKFQGWAWTTEWISRSSSNPFILDPQTNNPSQIILEGTGLNSQLSYLFRNNFELALRFASIKPADRVIDWHPEREEYLVGGTYYLNKHRIKVQLNIGKYYDRNTLISMRTDRDRWVVMTQVEFGI
jgi:phosphate-selective porin OprO/OprP